MAILQRVIEESSYSTQSEIWELKNGLTFRIFFGNETDVHISSTSGDVSDQVYEQLIKLEQYKDIELIPLWCYFIRVDKSIVKGFMIEVEKIDPSKLKQGKIY